MLQGEQSHWSGSPRGPHRRAQPASASQSGSDEEEEQEWEESESVTPQQQAESLVQPLHQLECVVVAGESLCRQACNVTDDTQVMRQQTVVPEN